MELAQILVILAFAVLAVVVFQALRLGPVLGYLAAGALIGPHALGLVRDVETMGQTMGRLLGERGVPYLALDMDPALVSAASLVRARTPAHSGRLREAGATAVVPELVEGSLQLGEELLLALEVPRAEAVELLDRYREGSYALLQDLLQGRHGDRPRSR